MRNIFFKISYKGTNYHGSQFQKNAISIMDTFQSAIKKIIKDAEFQLKACSRTDAGVHANSFCINMITECCISCDALKKGLNSALPCDIAVLECRDVSEDFHARYSCKGKRYIYKIWNSDVKNPFLGDLAFQYKYKIDEDKLNK
ncbi:MAG: tRNA pseudouridine synthase A, partial [Oscillospiraceae bacterium]